MSHLLLSHLSKENNSPELVESLFTSAPFDTQVVIASRHRESAIYEIALKEHPLRMLIPKIIYSKKQQLSLF